MSVKEPTIEKLNGNTYIITNWGVDKALETLVWITKTFGEGLITLLFSEGGVDTLKEFAKDDKTNDEVDAEKELVSDFAKRVIDRLDAKEYVKYAKLIVSGTKCNAQDIDFNQHFMGSMGELHMLLFAILKHQYSDFLGGSGLAD